MMKLYHATRSTARYSALDIAQQIADGGFVASYDPNHEAAVVSLADKPLTGWGGGGGYDAWVEVDVPDDVAQAHRYTWDDDLYHCKCYAFPESIINEFEMRSVTARRLRLEEKRDEWEAEMGWSRDE